MHVPRGYAVLLLAVLGAAVAAGQAGAQENADAKTRLEKTPRHHEWAQIKSAGGRTVRAYVAYPEVDKPAPGVVVIHENRGLTDWVRSVADGLAGAGLVAIAPDLLSGTGPGGGGTESYANEDAAGEGIYKLDAEQVLRDLDATVKHLGEDGAVSDKIAVAGFCWGGGQTFRYAGHSDQISAAFVFYGPAPEQAVLEKIRVPVYGFYGGNDFRITGKVPETEAAMKQLGKRYEAAVYEGAGHGFMRAGEEPAADAANRKARDEGWKKLVALLGKI